LFALPEFVRPRLSRIRYQNEVLDSLKFNAHRQLIFVDVFLAEAGCEFNDLNDSVEKVHQTKKSSNPIPIDVQMCEMTLGCGLELVAQGSLKRFFDRVQMEELRALVETPVFDFTHEVNPRSHVVFSKLPFLLSVAYKWKTPTTEGNLALLN